jgi:hypothetical protein
MKMIDGIPTMEKAEDYPSFASLTEAQQAVIRQACEASTRARQEQDNYLIENGVMPEYNDEAEHEGYRARLIAAGFDPDECELEHDED